jgi:hypothetical protein
MVMIEDANEKITKAVTHTTTGFALTRENLIFRTLLA